MVSDRMLFSILSMSVEPPEKLCAETADALAPQARDLKPEDLLSLLHLMFIQEVKFVLQPILSFYHYLGSLARLGLVEFSIASPLGFKPSLAHFHRQLGTAGAPLPQAILPGLVPKVLIGLS